MVKIDFLLATFLLVLPAAWGGSPTTEPVSSNQQKRSPETVAPSAGSTTRQLHAQLGNQNIVKMMTATTTRGDFRTGLLQTPQPAASPMKSKLLTEDFNIRAKRSTSSSATPQEETLKNKVTINKRWRQERNKEDPAWAGPTPFLDGEIQPRLIGVEDDSMVHKPSSKRVSLQSFLPRRSDKRQSLLKEEEDQVPMEDFQEGTTFGKVQNDSVNSNGTASIDGTTDKPQPPPETTSSTEGNVNLGQDPIEEEATTPVPPNDTLSAPTAPLLDVDLGPPIGEEAPLTPNDAPFVPPPPPMPSEK
ncbi:protein EVI2B [Arapaima gigas]